MRKFEGKKTNGLSNAAENKSPSQKQKFSRKTVTISELQRGFNKTVNGKPQASPPDF